MKKLNIALWYQTVVPIADEDVFFERVSRLRENLIDISGVSVVNDGECVEIDIDMHIVLLDHCSLEFVQQINVIAHCDSLLWCFVLRSTLPPPELSMEVVWSDRHKIYPYDSDDDIIRMVSRHVGSKEFTPVADDTLVDVIRSQLHRAV